MHLRNAGTRPSPPLHNTISRLTGEGNPKDLLGGLTEILADHGLDILPVILRRVVEHARKHLLELGRQDRRLHRDRLADLQIQPAILAQQVGEAFCVAPVDGGDGARQRRVRAEVQFIIHGHEEAQREGPGGPGQTGRVELAVDAVDDAGGQGHVEQTAEPFPGSRVGLRGGWLAQGGGRGRNEGLEFLRMEESAGWKGAM